MLRSLRTRKEGALLEERAEARGADRAADMHRVTRDLRRLEALVARRRLRVRLLRTLRGGLGAGATLAALIKLKVAGSLAVKLGLAALVGLGLAWPFVALAVIFLAGLVLSILSLFGEGSVSCPDGDCDCGCHRREARAERLRQLIARRRDWLAEPAGPAPGRRTGAAQPLK
ncbi:hypothetical protein [Methylobacterium goesingense]|uniref:Phage holin family protein n=1 Tax=Methylobacterium goesingense TaxID=243690 RepID=A0ABV2L1I3_9HYPH|nr:hypothetical protein [Methylobacterium goesingense]GJD74473.1 hypothetical protein CFIICLFH_2707 [Methylobacterium goesingense]